jgi:hypothetical protein
MTPDQMRPAGLSQASTGRGWAYLGAALGGVVSIAANVAHSYVPPAHTPAGWSPEGGAVIGAVFWPVAVFVAVEILARTAWPSSRRWVVLRYAGLLPVGVVAALVSYRHLSGLLDFYGEDTLTAMIGPLAVDGLMVMATGALIATSPQRPAAVTAARAGAQPDTEPDTQPVTEPDTPTDTGADTAAEAKRTGPRTSGRTRERAPKRPPRRTSRRDTAAAIVRLRKRHPDMPVSDIARRLRVSDRTVRRHLANPTHTIPAVPDHTGDPEEPGTPAPNSPTDPSALAA